MKKIMNAKEMAAAKWRAMTFEERAAHIAKMTAGAKKRWASISKEDRSNTMKRVRSAGKRTKD